MNNKTARKAKGTPTLYEQTVPNKVSVFIANVVHANEKLKKILAFLVFLYAYFFHVFF